MFFLMFDFYKWMKHPVLDNGKAIYEIYFSFAVISHMAQV